MILRIVVTLLYLCCCFKAFDVCFSVANKSFVMVYFCFFVGFQTLIKALKKLLRPLVGLAEFNFWLTQINLGLFVGPS